MIGGRYASAVARDLALSEGLHDVEIIGTGRGGAVTVADVRRAVPAAPEGLGDAGLRLYRAVTGEWELRPDERELLAAACRTVDELASLERAIAKASVVVRGSKGQPRANPLIGQAREHRLALRLLLTSVGLSDADAQDGRNEALARSSAGRKLALIRHGGRRG